MSISHNPTYNLKAVLKETGIAADTLRAWERRYRLPMPERTPGGHRLYSQYDIETIKWLIMKQSEGLTISRAVDLWNELISSGEDPLLLNPQADQRIRLPAANLELARKDWLNACLAYDEASAERILNQAFAMYPTETVCVELLQRGIQRLGEMWFSGEASVQHEHFSSNLVTRRLDALIAAAPPPTRPYTILIGCPPGEWHTLPLLFATLFLRRRGLNIIYLGANVPPEQFEETLAIVRPHLVILAAQQLHTTVSLRDTARALADAGEVVGYGGRNFNLKPELRKQIPAHFLGETLEIATQTVESLLRSKPAPPYTEPTPEKFQALLNSYRHNKPLIEANILQRSIEQGVSIEHINAANHFLGINLSAALEMGDPVLLEAEMFWIGERLGKINNSQADIRKYLFSYSQAISAHLGEQGKILIDWLQRFSMERGKNNV